jgi:hypothetical protein
MADPEELMALPPLERLKKCIMLHETSQLADLVKRCQVYLPVSALPDDLPADLSIRMVCETFKELNPDTFQNDTAWQLFLKFRGRFGAQSLYFLCGAGAPPSDLIGLDAVLADIGLCVAERTTITGSATS